MTKHLFLEGPIRSGKSTLIKNCLRDFNGTLGGFSCKRYLDDTGSIRAFGLVSPADFDVECLYDPQIHGDPDKGVPAKDPGIFLIKSTHGMQADTDAFIRTGISLLDTPKNADIILLDEIGGVELMSDVFRKKLEEVLSGDTPCIGVLKQQSHAKVMQDHHGKNPDTKREDDPGACTENASAGRGETPTPPITQINDRLRKDIAEKYDGIILHFDRENADKTEDLIRNFLNSVST